MKNFMYDLISANLEYGVKVHPQSDMKALGYRVIKSEPVPIADCWWFRVEDNNINNPGYLHELSDNFKFSDEYYNNSKKHEATEKERTPPEFKADGSLTDYGRYVRGLDYK